MAFILDGCSFHVAHEKIGFDDSFDVTKTTHVHCYNGYMVNNNNKKESRIKKSFMNKVGGI